MGYITSYGQEETTTLQITLPEFTPDLTLLHARLAVFTSFVVNAAEGSVIPYAPPNTLLGIGYTPAGTPADLVTQANWSEAQWYTAGMGEMTAMDSYAYSTGGVGPNILAQTYAQTLELETPVAQPTAYNLGISANFLGGGFWPNVTTWLSWQFIAHWSS